MWNTLSPFFPLTFPRGTACSARVYYTKCLLANLWECQLYINRMPRQVQSYQALGFVCLVHLSKNAISILRVAPTAPFPYPSTSASASLSPSLSPFPSSSSWGIFIYIFTVRANCTLNFTDSAEAYEGCMLSSLWPRLLPGRNDGGDKGTQADSETMRSDILIQLENLTSAQNCCF